MLHKKESLILFLGDVVLLGFSFWSAFVLRWFELPQIEDVVLNIPSFFLLITVWVLVFFIAGLYDKHTTIFSRKLPTIILYAQAANSVLAMLFFYFIPSFKITPKTIVFLYLGISFLYISWWRLYGIGYLGARRRARALLIGAGEEMHELETEINGNPRYSFSFFKTFDLKNGDGVDIGRAAAHAVEHEQTRIIVIDLANEQVERALPMLYNLLFSRARFVDFNAMYEEVFNRIPVSRIGYQWFLRNVSPSSHFAYDLLKRVMDISVAGILALATLPLYPLVFLAITLDDYGEFFSFQTRVGRNNEPIRLMKFRTMKFNDGGKWGAGNTNEVTRVGAFLRTTRIDELPQLWNVLRGDISLIGPRPEFPVPVRHYEQEIPYYSARHIIKPGLSGWAQIYHERHPHHGVDVKETTMKLCYDLYYIKNRSLFLDLEIALKTVKILLSRQGL